MPGGPLLPRRDPIEKLPVLILMPHERCNCRCLMCDIWKSKGKNQLLPEEVRSWSAEWRRLGTRRVVLSGGEPLMHPGFVPLCESLRGAGLETTLLSTGLLLERAAEDVARLVDDVIVSLDGPREVHDAIRRVPGAFDRLAAGVRALRAVSPSLPVSARCTVQRANAPHLRATVAAALAIGLDGISFLAADVGPGAFGRGASWAEGEEASIAVPAGELPALEAEIEALERDCAGELATGFVAEPAGRLRARLLRHFAAHAGQGAAQDGPGAQKRVGEEDLQAVRRRADLDPFVGDRVGIDAEVPRRVALPLEVAAEVLALVAVVEPRPRVGVGLREAGAQVRARRVEQRRAHADAAFVRNPVPVQAALPGIVLPAAKLGEHVLAAEVLAVKVVPRPLRVAAAQQDVRQRAVVEVAVLARLRLVDRVDVGDDRAHRDRALGDPARRDVVRRVPALRGCRRREEQARDQDGKRLPLAHVVSPRLSASGTCRGWPGRSSRGSRYGSSGTSAR